jgi:hypothetical protein
MSLRSLSKNIKHCSEEMSLQRRCTHTLLDQQKNTLQQTLHQKTGGIPLPALMGIALVCGFLSEKLIRTPAPRQLWNIYLAWRSF